MKSVSRLLSRWIAPSIAAWTAVFAVAPNAGATPVAPGFQVTFLQTPGTATGDVISVGETVFAGVGDFGVGIQAVVRIDPSGTTVLAEGFNSLGGFAYDAVNDRLIVGDNGGNLPGALTGSTIYAIANPFGASGTPAAAQDLEILPSGSVPGYFDVVVDPTDPTGDTLFLSDASQLFPPDGRVLQVSVLSGSVEVVQGGLSFAAGLAADGDTLFVGDSLLDFSGQLSEVGLDDPDAPLSLVAPLPDGVFDVEIGPDGSLLATSGGSLVRIEPDGSLTTLASGFGFATGLYVGGSSIYVIDGFPSQEQKDRIWILSAIPEPGSALLFGGGLLVIGCRLHSRGRASDYSSGR